MVDKADELKMTTQIDGNDHDEDTKDVHNARSVSDADKHAIPSVLDPVDNVDLPSRIVVGAVNEKDSMSESEREKMGSTPENLKKIDDQYHANNSSASLSSSTEVTPDETVLNFLTSKTSSHIIDESTISLTVMNDSSASVNLKSNNEMKNEGGPNNITISDVEDESVTTSSSNDGGGAASLSNDNAVAAISHGLKPKLSCAFTIDHFEDGKKPDRDAQAAKYKLMLARFQNRHRRGNLISKMETDFIPPTEGQPEVYNNKEDYLANNVKNSAHPQGQVMNASYSRQPRTAQTSMKKSISNETNSSTNFNTTNSVTPRLRDRSLSGTRNAVQRHSWSPRSSTSNTGPDDNGEYVYQKHANQCQSDEQQLLLTSSKDTRLKKSKIPCAVPRGQIDLVANRSYNNFTPRSTAMQRALNDVNDPFNIPHGDENNVKIEYLGRMDGAVNTTHNYDRNMDFEYDPDFDVDCDFEFNPSINTLDSTVNIDASLMDTVSETGTYTLDGDNYTEEQKDLMNIDRNDDCPLSMESRQVLINYFLKRNSACTENNISMKYNAKNIDSEQEPYSHLYCTDSSCIHCEPSIKKPPAVDENWKKLSSNQRGRSDSISDVVYVQSPYCSKSSKLPPENKSPLDIGTVTSVSASGILAKQRTLHPCPKLSNSGDLCKTQVDSSEYISNATKFKNAVISAKENGHNIHSAFTDNQKACYGLNSFDNFNTYDGSDPMDSPANNTHPGDVSSMQQGQTKQEWILEWARKARARSLSKSNVSVSNCIDVASNGNNEDVCNTSLVTITSRNQSFNILHDDDAICENRKNVTATSRCSRESSRLTSAIDIRSQENNSEYNNSVLSTVTLSNEKRKPFQTLFVRSADEYGDDYMPSSTNAIYDDAVAAAADSNDYVRHFESAIHMLQRNIANQNLGQSPTPAVPSSPQTTLPATAHNANISYIYRVQSTPNYSQQQSKKKFGRDSTQLLSSSSSSLLQGGSSPCMTSSINEQQLQLLTSGEYLQRQRHQRRKSSLDGGGQIWLNGDCNASPHRRNQPHCSPTLQNQSAAFIRQNIDNNFEINSSNLFNNGAMCRSNSYSAQLKHNNGSATATTASTPVSVGSSTSRPRKCVSSAHCTRDMLRMNMTLPTEYRMQSVKKSASSNSFEQMYTSEEGIMNNIDYGDDDYDSDDGAIGGYGSGCNNDSIIGKNDCIQYYYQLEEEDDDDDGTVEVDIDDVPVETCNDFDNVFQRRQPLSKHAQPAERRKPVELPLSTARSNKALLMRIERSKQKINNPTGGGSIACPNTPEFNRRNEIHSNGSRNQLHTSSLRQSMPRDTNLNRLAHQVPKSLASAKKQLLKTAASVVRSPVQSTKQQHHQQRAPQSRYLNISKYKSAQSNQFLRKDESKSTLKGTNGSNSGGGGGLTRTDTTRSSNRSFRSLSAVNTNWNNGGSNSASAQHSTGIGGNNSGHINRSQSANRRDVSVSKQKELELAMWKRRAKYDPMKSAAEDRKRKEEAKRLAQMSNQYINETLSNDLQNNLVVNQSNHDMMEVLDPNIQWSLTEENDRIENVEYDDDDDDVNNCIPFENNDVTYMVGDN